MSDTLVAIIGGTGLYELGGIHTVTPHHIMTPYGEPSDAILEISSGKSRYLFLSRHGIGHRLLPTEINYRANIWALKSMGADWVVSVSAVGSLRESMRPGDVVLPSQVIDKTKGRPDTFFGNGVVAHVSMADPFCSVLREIATEAAQQIAQHRSFSVHNRGTYICIDGPCFSSRAEAHMHRSWGADIIGMTNLPEAKLAREAELAYGTIALVTDFDCWRDDGNDVHAHGVAEMVKSNALHAWEILEILVPRLSQATPSSYCRTALTNSIFSDLSKLDPSRQEELRPILARYLK